MKRLETRVVIGGKPYHFDEQGKRKTGFLVGDWLERLFYNLRIRPSVGCGCDNRRQWINRYSLLIAAFFRRISTIFKNFPD